MDTETGWTVWWYTWKLEIECKRDIHPMLQLPYDWGKPCSQGCPHIITQPLLHSLSFSRTILIFLLSIHTTNYRIKLFHRVDTFKVLFLNTLISKVLIYQNADRHSKEKRCLDRLPLMAKSYLGWNRSSAAPLIIPPGLTEWQMGPSQPCYLFISLQKGGRRNRQKAGWDCGNT